MTHAESHPGLWDLAGYFNEDWMEDAPTWEGVIDFYVANNPPEHCARGLAELHLLLTTETDDIALDRLVRELGFMYWPPPQTYREWLTEVRNRLAARL